MKFQNRDNKVVSMEANVVRVYYKYDEDAQTAEIDCVRMQFPKHTQ